MSVLNFSCDLHTNSSPDGRNFWMDLLKGLDKFPNLPPPPPRITAKTVQHFKIIVKARILTVARATPNHVQLMPLGQVVTEVQLIQFGTYIKQPMRNETKRISSMYSYTQFKQNN